MAQQATAPQGFRVLVCGSSRWSDRNFVYGMLQGFASGLPIAAIISGPFSGADEFARDFAKEHGIPYEKLNIRESERMALSMFDENRQLPDAVLKNDTMFSNGYEQLKKSGANVVFLIPNPEGRLGPTSACLKRMAKIVNITCINGAAALEAVSGGMVKAKAQIDAQAEPANEPELVEAVAASRAPRAIR